MSTKLRTSWQKQNSSATHRASYTPGNDGGLEVKALPASAAF
ncbi:MAG TPA: hypothetical protein VH186_27890 [Chloroflexia bacterium]|nr:hypothetical protein [Chloroflexia bacterium]